MPSLSSVAMLAAVAPTVAVSDYKLDNSLVGDNFFDPHFWNFFTDADPTLGAVRYVDFKAALKRRMVSASKDGAYIGVDLQNITKGDPIPSVRLESLTRYNSGLFILSMTHQPTGCGVWPAFWMTGDDAEHPWPSWGEADFLEGCHGQTEIWTTLHTWENCDQSKVKGNGVDFSGYWKPGRGPPINKTYSTNCSVIDGSQEDNEGCPIVGPANSMGAPFNAQGGGTFAFEWDPIAGYFRGFYWKVGDEPQDIIAEKPDPDTWGLPYAKFKIGGEACPLKRFRNMKMVLNTDFCGMWGELEKTFHEDCPDVDPNITCAEYVSMYPQNLKEAFWKITRFDIYQRDAAQTAQQEEEELIV